MDHTTDSLIYSPGIACDFNSFNIDCIGKGSLNLFSNSSTRKVGSSASVISINKNGICWIWQVVDFLIVRSQCWIRVNKQELWYGITPHIIIWWGERNERCLRWAAINKSLNNHLSWIKYQFEHIFIYDFRRKCRVDQQFGSKQAKRSNSNIPTMLVR